MEAVFLGELTGIHIFFALPGKTVFLCLSVDDCLGGRFEFLDTFYIPEIILLLQFVYCCICMYATSYFALGIMLMSISFRVEEVLGSIVCMCFSFRRCNCSGTVSMGS